jgi:hypothetical protein
VLRGHWVFAVLVVLAAALRGVVFAAYHPALIFPDSVRYLQYAHNFTEGRWSLDALRQSGYSVLLIPVVLLHAAWLIPLAQHIAGLATAALGYALLLRMGARPWLAAAAMVPVLFDPLQLILEQYVLADTWTVFLIVAALAILAWRRGPASKGHTTKRAAAACGLLLGLAVMFRDQELIMIVPAALYLGVTVRPWRRLAGRLAALIGCFLVPVAGYLGWFEASHGQWNFTSFSGAFLYGRVADFADCRGLSLPGYERPLCPAQPPAQRNADFYTWNPASPQWTFDPPPGMSRDAVVRDFSLRILRHQPLGYAEAVGRDLIYGFSPVRGAGPEKYSPAYLQFHTYIRPDRQAYASIAALGYQAPRLRPGLAAFLTGYGRWCYLPGPLLAAALLASLVACAVRRRPAGLLFTASAVLVLVPPAAFATFDWRYQLPQLVLIPLALVTAALPEGAREPAALPGPPLAVRRLVRLPRPADAGLGAGAGPPVRGQLHHHGVRGHVVPDDRARPGGRGDGRADRRRLLAELLVQRVLVLQAAHQPPACPGDAQRVHRQFLVLGHPDRHRLEVLEERRAAQVTAARPDPALQPCLVPGADLPQLNPRPQPAAQVTDQRAEVHPVRRAEVDDVHVLRADVVHRDDLHRQRVFPDQPA